MKHLMRYEGFSSSERLDEILDKILKFGIQSISKEEKTFLDSHKDGKEEEEHINLQFLENETILEDDSGLFKFEFFDIKHYKDETQIIGIIYVPDLRFESGKVIQGRLEGKIVIYENGETSPDFYVNMKNGNREIMFDVFEFLNGKECEFDSFIDYVVDELKNKKK